MSDPRRRFGGAADDRRHDHRSHGRRPCTASESPRWAGRAADPLHRRHHGGEPAGPMRSTGSDRLYPVVRAVTAISIRWRSLTGSSPMCPSTPGRCRLQMTRPSSSSTGGSTGPEEAPHDRAGHPRFLRSRRFRTLASCFAAGPARVEPALGDRLKDYLAEGPTGIDSRSRYLPGRPPARRSISIGRDAASSPAP